MSKWLLQHLCLFIRVECWELRSRYFLGILAKFCSHFLGKICRFLVCVWVYVLINRRLRYISNLHTQDNVLHFSAPKIGLQTIKGKQKPNLWLSLTEVRTRRLLQNQLYHHTAAASNQICVFKLSGAERLRCYGNFINYLNLTLIHLQRFPKLQTSKPLHSDSKCVKSSGWVLSS